MEAASAKRYFRLPAEVMPWFKDWFGTQHYALLYGHRDEQDARIWADLIVQRLALEPGLSVLDLACGSGRHAEWFVHAGMQVTGIDLSASCIRQAIDRVAQAEFVQQDMRVPFAQDRFDAVVCLFTSLGYSTDRADDQLALNAVAQALKPNGRFVLDLFNGALVRKELVADEIIERQGVRFTIRRNLHGGDVVKHIIVDEGGIVKEYMERVHAWQVQEVQHMVNQAGLVVDDVTDGPDPSPFEAEVSKRIVVWAHKPA